MSGCMPGAEAVALAAAVELAAAVQTELEQGSGAFVPLAAATSVREPASEPGW